MFQATPIILQPNSKLTMSNLQEKTRTGMIAKDRKGNPIKIGDIVKSKHGTRYKVLGFAMEEDNQIIVKVDPIEDRFVFRWGRELEVI